MSLATRCPVCSTVFRVVQDQLKVSEGWVRCGRCAKVFNAFEGLFDLERELGTAAPPSVTPSQRVLEDLAHRNRQPRQRSEWTGDEFPDTGASVRIGTTPSPPANESARSGRRSNSGFAPLPPPSTPAWSSSKTTRLDEASSAAALPAWAASKPAPLSDAAGLPLRAAIASNSTAPSSTAAAALDAGGKPGFAPSRPAPAWPTPAAPAPAPAVPVPRAAETAPMPTAGTGAAASVAFTSAAATRAGQEFAGARGPAVAAPVPVPVSPAPAPVNPALAAASAAEVPLRVVPAPVDADSEASEGSYESMFRSTGELDPQTAHPSGLDIVLDPDEARAEQSETDAPDSRYLSFVQEAERAARWQRPGVRIALAVASIVLAGLLVLQLAIAERDQLAVRWPASKPLLGAACVVLGCTIEPLRRIDRLAVESSGLTRIGDAQVYRLAMVLHNRSEWPLQVPAVDLTLTDSGGGLVSRRVLTPSELGSAASTIAPGQEVPLQVMLRSNDRPITGYTIEIFYP